MTKYLFFFVPLLIVSGCGTSDSLSRFHDTNNSKTDLPSVHLSEKEMKTAEELFKICEVCHGKRAQLHALDLSRIIGKWKSEDIRDALEGYKNRTRDITGYGYIMQGEVRFLDYKEIALLSKYIPILYNQGKREGE